MSISASQALKDYSVELLDHLPLEIDKFFAMTERAGLFPLDTGSNIKAKDTRAKKVSYFLDVIRPGADIYLPKLLEVMKDKDSPPDVVQLADKIAAATGIGGSQPKAAATVSSMSTSSDFDYLAKAEYFKTNRVELCQLKYKSMRKHLISHNVITEDEADEIDAIPIRSDKMDKVLTIVETSLKLKLPTKYKGLLKSMEESLDDDLKAYAKKLGGSNSVPDS